MARRNKAEGGRRKDEGTKPEQVGDSEETAIIPLPVEVTTGGQLVPSEGTASESAGVVADIPWGDIPERVHIINHLDVQLKHDQAVTLRHIFEGCRGRAMANGRLVQTVADAVRYLLERIGDGLRSRNPG